MIHSSLTTTMLLGLPVALPEESRRVTHLLDKSSHNSSGGWSPSDWKKIRENNLKAVNNAVISGLSYPAVIADATGISPPSVRECLIALVSSGHVEMYRVGTGKRSFYRKK